MKCTVAALLCSVSSAFLAPSSVRRSFSLQSSYLDNLGRQPDSQAAPTTTATTTASPFAPAAPVPAGPSQLTVAQEQTAPVNQPNRAPKHMFDTAESITVQGASLRTWSFSHPSIDHVQVLLTTAGRPLNANIELWQGPDNTPQILRSYSEDGKQRPLRVLMQTPHDQNAVAVRNTAEMEFPLQACTQTDQPSLPGSLQPALEQLLSDGVVPTVIQGGALKTFSFDAAVRSVQVLLQTDGRPMNARLELLQGPNNNKQVVELYTEDGKERPFFAILETPGAGNVVRILNTAPLEFPLAARAEPYVVASPDETSAMITTSAGDWHGVAQPLVF